MSERTFRYNNEFQVVECATGFAYVWPEYYPPLRVGETVLVDANHVHGQQWTEVTELGTEKGGALGNVIARGSQSR
jgi:hypothetical protein